MTLVSGQDNVGVYLSWPGTSTYDASLSQYAATVGAAPAYADVFIDFTQPMSSWVNNAQTAAVELRADTDGATVIPVIALPLISSASNGLTELQNFAAIASGADDSTWTGIVEGYLKQGYTTIDLRIGWEQNGNWYPWSVSTEAEAQGYIAAFQHISTLVHSISGIKVNVIWDPAEVGSSAVPTEAMYPGNSYVDIIGVDAYDSVYPLSLYDWSTHTTDATLAEWEANPVNLDHYWNYPDATASAPTGTGAGFGLADAIAFAKANGKPLALPETGAGGSSASPSADDSVFPQYLATTLLAAGGPTIAFADLWDSGADTFSDGSKPNEAAAWAAFVKEMNQGDAGPTASAGSTTVVHGQTVNLGSQVAALIIPGQVGDTETVTAVSVTLGSVELGPGGAIDYTAPASGTATLTYTVTDQLGDVGTFTDTINVDSGPTEAGGSITVGHGKTLNLTSQLLALVTPGVAGDTETITAITASTGAVTLGAGGIVTYTAPASGTDTLTYTVADQVGDKASFNTAVGVDPGPQLAAGSTSVVEGTTAALGPAIAALIAPGISGTTETITAISAARGTVTLGANGAINYTAPATTGTDTLTYTVVDQYGDTAIASYPIAVIPTPAIISGDTTILGPSYPSWGGLLSGATVALVNASGSVLATTTPAGAWYVFRNVSPGSYRLQFTAPAGTVLEPGGLANVSTGLTAAFTLTPGEAYASPNANFVQAASITGTVMLGEAGISGVTVAVINAAGSVVATTTTNSTGALVFGALEAGTYQVRYTPPGGNGLVAGGPASTTTDLTASITLVAGQTVALPAETVQPLGASISGSVNYGGTGQAGVAVVLLNAANIVVATTATGGTGAFSFAGVAPGSYQVRYTAPAGEALQSGGPANAATGLTAPVTVSAGQTLTLGAETLAALPGTIDGTIHHFGGSTDPTWGSGQSGVTVALLNAADVVVATTVSGSNGWFDFTNVTAGTYEFHYTLPSGLAFEAAAGINPATGVTTPFVIAPGATVWTPTAQVISTPIAEAISTPSAEMMLTPTAKAVSTSNAFVMNGANNVVSLGAGNYTVSGTASSSQLTLGAGNQTVSLTGAGNSVVTGAGNQAITLAGTGNTVTIGAGTSTVNTGSGKSIVHAAGGDVTIAAAGAGNLLDSGPGMSFLNTDGSASNTFVLNAAGQGLTTITGFNQAGHDILDLARTLAGTDISSDLSNIASYVTSSVTGGNTTLFVDPTGGHGTPDAFAVLNNVTTSVGQLLAAHDLSIA
jgi:hypothetical protein